MLCDYRFIGEFICREHSAERAATLLTDYGQSVIMLESLEPGAINVYTTKLVRKNTTRVLHATIAIQEQPDSKNQVRLGSETCSLKDHKEDSIRENFKDICTIASMNR